MRSNLIFFKESLINFYNTGAIWPTSKLAAKELSKPLIDSKKPISVLEVGAGTGSVTKELIKYLKPEDKITVCEMNPKFMNITKNDILENPEFKDKIPNISFFEGPIENYKAKKKYDFICCALPFVNFTPEKVTEIFNYFVENTNEDGVMTYYKYIGVSNVARPFMGKKYHNRQLLLKEIFNNFLEKRLIRTKRIYFNLPPVRVHTLRLNSEA